MKDSATQIEEEAEKTRRSMHQHKMEMNKLKDKLARLDNKDPNYVSIAYWRFVCEIKMMNTSSLFFAVFLIVCYRKTCKPNIVCSRNMYAWYCV